MSFVEKEGADAEAVKEIKQQRRFSYEPFISNERSVYFDFYFVLDFNIAFRLFAICLRGRIRAGSAKNGGSIG